MSESSPEGSSPQKTPTSSKSSSAKSPSRRKKPRRKTKAAQKPRAPRRGKKRSRVRLRRIVSGKTYFVTKKTSDGQFFLRPDGTVNAILLYVLLERIKKHGLLLHEFVFMSNHFHVVVTDRFGKLPDFMREFGSETGKALKVALKTSRRIWSNAKYDLTELLDVDAAEHFMIYTRLNPTKAGLTEPKDWPGLTSASWQYGDTIEAERPAGYFDPRERADRVSCVLEPLPEAYGEATAENASTLAEIESELVEDAAALKRERAKFRRRCAKMQKKIDPRTADNVEEILDERKRSNDPGKRKLAGAEAVKKVSRLKRGNHPFGGMNPRFASKDPQRLNAAIEDERVFRASHEQARIRYLNGEQGVLFPTGTYGYREQFGVRVRKGGAAA